MNDDKERAPLDFGTGSKKSILVGCPYCKSFRSRNINCVGYICGSCKKYVLQSKFLGEEDFNKLEGAKMLSRDKTRVSKEHMKLRKDMEEKAYAYKDKVERGEIPEYNDPNK